MAYVRIADKLKQLNNSDFKLVDSVDIEMEDGTDLQSTIDAIKASTGSSVDSMTIDEWHEFFSGLTIDVSSTN